MNYKIPGIYIEPEPEQIEQISLSEGCLAGFIGIAEKGPLNVPVRIKNFQQYEHYFGSFNEYGYLPYAVHGFFASGGEECIIVRIAHVSEKGSSIKHAYLDVKGFSSKVACRFKANTPGSWGNNINVRLWYMEEDFSSVVSSFDDERESFTVESSRGITAGDSIILFKGKLEEYFIVKNVEKNKITVNRKISKTFKLNENKIFCRVVNLNITVTCKNRVEEYFHLSNNPSSKRYYADAINDKSQLVSVEVIDDCNHPAELFSVYLENGDNGISDMTPSDFIGHYYGLDDYSGMGVFESISNIRLLAAPDVLVFNDIVHKSEIDALNDILTVQMNILEQCERLGTRFAILDIPKINDTLLIQQFASYLPSAYGALYLQHIVVNDPFDRTGRKTVMIPPSGHITGIVAKTDLENGAHVPPANKFLPNAIDMSFHLEDSEYEQLYGKGINSLRYVPGRGIKIWGARTLSDDICWRYINVRRAFSLMSEAIKHGTQWAVFEPNTEQLRKRLVRHVAAFLLEEWNKGSLSGVVPEDGFYVRCDEELNPVEDIDDGIIRVEVGIAIVKPAEFLVISLEADKEHATMISV